VRAFLRRPEAVVLAPPPRSLFPSPPRDADSRFSQQQMAACRPVLTPKAARALPTRLRARCAAALTSPAPPQVVAIYLSLGCFFIPIGAKCLLTTNGVR